MRKGYKDQSATEYLLTYGWMILIIAILTVTLFGLTGLRLNVQFVCLGQPGFLCSMPQLSTSGALTMNISYGGSTYPITITGLACNVSPSSKQPSVETTHILVYPGQHARLEFQCPIINSAIGSTNNVFLWIYYSTPMASGLQQQIGRGVLPIQYSGIAWNVTEWTPSSSSVGLLPYPDLTTNPISPSEVINVNTIVWTSFVYQGAMGWGYSTDYHNHDVYDGIQITLFPISPLSLDTAGCSNPYDSHGYTATTFVNMGGTYTFTTWTDDGTEIFYKPVPGSTWTSVFGGTAWKSQPPAEYSSSVTLAQGEYEIAVDYIDSCDPAGLSVILITPPPQLP